MSIQRIAAAAPLALFDWERVHVDVYSSGDDMAEASAVKFDLSDTNHGKVMSTKSDRIYYVVRGKGTFISEDESVEVGEGDVILVPKNTAYDYSGTMKLFLVRSPAFDESAEKLLEKKEGRN